MSLLPKIRSRLDFYRTYRLLRTNYGRSAGWNIYLRESKIGELLDPQCHDMFWEAYQLVVTDPTYAAPMRTTDFWYEHPITFQSKALQELAPPYVMIVVPSDLAGDRVVARSLYLSPVGRIQEYAATCVVLALEVVKAFQK